MKKYLVPLMILIITLVAFTSCDTEAVYYTVTVDYGIDWLPLFKVTVKEGDTFAQPKDPEMEGWTFDGWLNEDGNSFDFSKPITSNVTVAAAWFLKNSTVTLKDTSGNIIKKVTVKYGSTYTLPTDLGYTIASCVDEDDNSITGSVKVTKANMVLTITKGTYTEYSIGDIGPGGGYIVFDADYSGSNELYTHYFEGYSSATLGWRYLEAATSDLEESYVFGYYRGSGTNSVIVSKDNGEKIGKGRSNTAALVAKMGKTSLSEENGGDKAEYAAYVAQSYDGGGYSDWFLPSSKELEMLDLLNRMSKGGVKTGSTNYYWTSTEHDGTNAENTSFLSGGGIAGGDVARSSKNYVRPFRCF